MFKLMCRNKCDKNTQCGAVKGNVNKSEVKGDSSAQGKKKQSENRKK